MKFVILYSTKRQIILNSEMFLNSPNGLFPRLLKVCVWGGASSREANTYTISPEKEWPTKTFQESNKSTEEKDQAVKEKAAKTLTRNNQGTRFPEN